MMVSRFRPAYEVLLTSSGSTTFCIIVRIIASANFDVFINFCRTHSYPSRHTLIPLLTPLFKQNRNPNIQTLYYTTHPPCLLNTRTPMSMTSPRRLSRTSTVHPPPMATARVFPVRSILFLSPSTPSNFFKSRLQPLSHYHETIN
jgi:hypothetical protein